MGAKRSEYPEDANGYRLQKGDMVELDGRPWMVDGVGKRFETFVALNLRTGESRTVKGYDCTHIANGSSVKNVRIGAQDSVKREFL